MSIKVNSQSVRAVECDYEYCLQVWVDGQKVFAAPIEEELWPDTAEIYGHDVSTYYTPSVSVTGDRTSGDTSTVSITIYEQMNRPTDEIHHWAVQINVDGATQIYEADVTSYSFSKSFTVNSRITVIITHLGAWL